MDSSLPQDTPADFYGVENIIEQLEAEERDGQMLTPEEADIVDEYRNDQRQFLEKKLTLMAAHCAMQGISSVEQN